MRKCIFHFCLFFWAHSPGLYGQMPETDPPFLVVNQIENVWVDLRYFGSQNFVGSPIEGYHLQEAWLTEPAWRALQRVAERLKREGLGLKVFDAYRPQRAVDHFVRWARDTSDTLHKARYYPQVPKSALFARGYIAARSGHSRGSTVDLTLVDRHSGKELDMGTPFDFFGPESHPFSVAVSAQQRSNRMKLREYMLAEGFEALPTEWWHFTLADEPFPDTYFDFIIYR